MQRSTLSDFFYYDGPNHDVRVGFGFTLSGKRSAQKRVRQNSTLTPSRCLSRPLGALNTCFFKNLTSRHKTHLTRSWE